jgi:flagellar FliJ protein
MPIFRLAGVLRARTAQETVAKAEVAKSRFAAGTALAEVHRQAATLDRADQVHYSTANALAGALMGRQAMAAALSVAIGVAGEADAVVADRMADLAVAARQRMAMDKLAERHALTRQRKLEAVERAELDDLVNARHGRAAKA